MNFAACIMDLEAEKQRRITELTKLFYGQINSEIVDVYCNNNQHVIIGFFDGDVPARFIADATDDVMSYLQKGASQTTCRLTMAKRYYRIPKFVHFETVLNNYEFNLGHRPVLLESQKFDDTMVWIYNFIWL